MSELDKITAWANAAKANPVLQALFPPSNAIYSTKYFLWAGHFGEYESGRWWHPGMSDEETEAIDEALGGDGTEGYTLLQWSMLGGFAYPGAKSGKPSSGVLRSQAIQYQWLCAHAEIAHESRLTSDVEKWAEGRVMSEEEITAALLADPIKPVFPDDQQLPLFEEASHA